MKATPLPTYTATLYAALCAIETWIAESGLAFAERQEWDRFWAFCGGISYETSKSRTGTPLLKDGKAIRKCLQVTLYRMPSGNYEIVAYVA
jgi:hypothetical protein